MNNIELNQQAVRMLELWDPFQLGEDAYTTETADVVAALQGEVNEQQLARTIQQVYEFSFEQWIEMEQCTQMARELLQLKTRYQCEL